MRPGKRFGLSAIERSDIWRRWKAGQTLHEIGRAFDKPHTSIRCLLLPRGGIPPAARHRSGIARTLAEREDISRGIACGSSIREISRHLERAASTVSREVRRHGGRSVYRASPADDRAWDSALRPKPCLLAVSRKLRNVVASKLILDWSPEQISGWLKSEYPGDESMRVSHETIYRSLFIQARGVLKKELMEHLRSKRRMRRGSFALSYPLSQQSFEEAILGAYTWYGMPQPTSELEHAHPRNLEMNEPHPRPKCTSPRSAEKNTSSREVPPASTEE